VANTIKLKRSAVASNVPTTGQIAQGELAINTAHKKLYSNDGTAVFEIGVDTFSALGHNHSGVYEPADATILKDADIGVNVAAFSHSHTDYLGQSGGTYPGIAPSGSETGWVRAPTSGILPNVSGGASSSLGSSFWKWNQVYAVTFNENGTNLASKYAALSHTHSYLPLTGGTLTGKLSIASGAGSEMLLLKDLGGAGAASNPYIGFDDSAGVRQGYVGFGLWVLLKTVRSTRTSRCPYSFLPLGHFSLK